MASSSESADGFGPAGPEVQPHGIVCPCCAATMVQQSHRGIPLDLCLACHGVWFDGGELEAYNAGPGPSTLSAAAGLDRAFQPTGESTLKRCPRCGRDILRTGSIGRHCVMRCTTCGGIFLPWPDSSRDRHAASRVIHAALKALKEITTARG